MRSDHRSDRVWLFAFIAVALLLGSIPWHWRSQAGGLIPAANRRTLPDILLPQLGGGQWRLADHRGQVVLINYWATWCGPCREELPGLMQVARDSGPKGLAVVGVSLDTGADVPARVQQFVAQYRVPYPVAFPPPRMLGATRDVAIPTTVLIDRHGRLVKTYYGAVEHEDFAKDVAALLAES